MRDLFRFLYRARNTILFLALLIVAMVMLVSGNAHQRAQAISSSNAVVGSIMALRNDISSYANLKEVNAQLAAENASWRSRHIGAYTPVEARFVRIRDTIMQQDYRYIPARVINSTTHKQRNFITLDRGARAGISPGMGVIGPNGVLGVVRESSANFTSVISVLDPNLSIGVMLAGSLHFGPLSWETGDPRTARMADIARHVAVAVGDTVVTRGGDGVFPSGIPVGTVIEVRDEPGSNYHSITLRLSEDLTRSATAYVIVDILRMERDSLEGMDPAAP